MEQVADSGLTVMCRCLQHTSGNLCSFVASDCSDCNADQLRPFSSQSCVHFADHGSRQGHTSEGNGQPSESALKDSPQWAAYKASLAKNGYFQGNIPGSAQYKQLLAVAVQSFTQNEAYEQSVDAAAEPGETIAAILQQPINRDQFKVLALLHLALALIMACSTYDMNAFVFNSQSCLFTCSCARCKF